MYNVSANIPKNIGDVGQHDFFFSKMFFKFRDKVQMKMQIILARIKVIRDYKKSVVKHIQHLVIKIYLPCNKDA